VPSDAALLLLLLLLLQSKVSHTCWLHNKLALTFRSFGWYKLKLECLVMLLLLLLLSTGSHV
jgi:hypothetical protein